VGCGVCDTPELWRGAVGLCARARACAGAAESLHTCIPLPIPIATEHNTNPRARLHHSTLILTTPRSAVALFIFLSWWRSVLEPLPTATEHSRGPVCACIRVCAGAAESLHTYIHIILEPLPTATDY